jgi:hypothetical protein
MRTIGTRARAAGDDMATSSVSVVAIGKALAQAYEDPQPEGLKELYDLVTVLDNLGKR